MYIHMGYTRAVSALVGTCTVETKSQLVHVAPKSKRQKSSRYDPTKFADKCEPRKKKLLASSRISVEISSNIRP